MPNLLPRSILFFSLFFSKSYHKGFYSNYLFFLLTLILSIYLIQITSLDLFISRTSRVFLMDLMVNFWSSDSSDLLASLT